MYFDEDGDLAHEFYEEEEEPDVGTGEEGATSNHGGGRGTTTATRRRRMRRVPARRLRPQGEVLYAHPRLHVDFPIILYQG